LNSEYEEEVEKVRKAFEMIEHVPKDRLDYLNYIAKTNNVIAGIINIFTARLSNSELSSQYDMGSLKIIHGHYCESARCLLEMTQHFLDKMIEEANENPFAV